MPLVTYNCTLRYREHCIMLQNDLHLNHRQWLLSWILLTHTETSLKKRQTKRKREAGIERRTVCWLRAEAFARARGQMSENHLGLIVLHGSRFLKWRFTFSRNVFTSMIARSPVHWTEQPWRILARTYVLVHCCTSPAPVCNFLAAEPIIRGPSVFSLSRYGHRYLRRNEVTLRLGRSPYQRHNLTSCALEWRATHVENFLFQHSLSFKYI